MRKKLAIVNNFLWPICQFTWKTMNKLALVNNFAMTKKFLNAKFDCTSAPPSQHYIYWRNINRSKLFSIKKFSKIFPNLFFPSILHRVQRWKSSTNWCVGNCWWDYTSTHATTTRVSKVVANHDDLLTQSRCTVFP